MVLAGRHATETGANATGHVVFQRNLAGKLAGVGDAGDGFQHAVRAADVERGLAAELIQMLFQCLGDEAFDAKRTILGRHMAVNAQRLEILKAEDIRLGPATDKQAYRRFFLREFLAQRVERGEADAATDDQLFLIVAALVEARTQRAENIDDFSGMVRGEQGGPLADDLVEHFEPGLLVRTSVEYTEGAA